MFYTFDVLITFLYLECRADKDGALPTLPSAQALPTSQTFPTSQVQQTYAVNIPIPFVSYVTRDEFMKEIGRLEGRLDKEVTSLGNKFNDIQKDFENLKKDFEALGNKFDTFNQVWRQELDKLDKKINERISKLDKKLDIKFLEILEAIKALKK